LTRAVKADSYYQRQAEKEPLFDSLRSHPDFIRLMGK
jgi:hypothetical protein